MNLGVRLPGPFRVGVNTQTGRVTGGVTLGPVSLSGNIGQARPVAANVIRCDLDQAAHLLVAEGWTITGRDATGLTAQKGWWRGAYVRVVPGGVTATRSMPARLLGALVFSAIALMTAVIMVAAAAG